MDHDSYEANVDKARAFFERAEEVASTDNFDYAIDLYMEGLRLSPDALEDGHAPLRRLGLIRQGKGGKKPSMMEKMRHLKGKTPLEEMLNAEYLMAKDPDNLAYAETLLKAAVAGRYLRTTEWMAHLIFEANKASNKPSFDTYILLKNVYSQIQMFSNAVVVCNLALQLRPSDSALRDELRDLSASMTMEKGKYGKGQDFRDSIRDREGQERLQSQENIVKSTDVKQQAVDQARRKIQQGSATVTNILELANALFDLETPAGEEEALTLLDNAYAKSKDFTFMKRHGEFRIKKLRNYIRGLSAAAQKEPQNQVLQKQLQQSLHQFDEVELEHFKKCEENYPTDLRMKYEHGRCLLKTQQFDRAIPLFQESQKDPRLKVAAMDKMGLCFLLKGWADDAIEIFQQALENCQTRQGTLAKDISYNLARAYESDGKIEEALKIYRKLAQTDFSYKDVGQRIDNLRKNGTR
ncbi:MAG: tetratricopeptide repeat protein [Planctomycetales bacterium]|nr:tetratricopeptide repeat protein [Planctomycetales bacterium]